MAARNALALVVLMISFLVLAGIPATRALECSNIMLDLAHCVSYAQGKGPLTGACCSGVKSLNMAARSTADRKTACNCLKNLVSRISGINAELVAGIPKKCNVNVPYPIRASTDCNKIL